MANTELGTVVSTEEGPTTNFFSFVISSNAVRKGQFVKVKSEQSGAGAFVVGSVSEITRANRYFERAESVAEYERTSPMSESFPTAEWEYTVAAVRVHGVFEDGRIARSTFPVAPGTKVIEADEPLLKKFLQLDDSGINLGSLQHHKLDAKLSMGKLFQKHLAILAMSGSGKSYLTAVMIEEMLERPSSLGRMGVVVIDNHGEYSGFRQTQYGKQTEVIDAKKFRVAYRKVTPQMLKEWVPEMSATQYRELVPIMESLRKEMKEKHESRSLDDLIARIESEMADKKKDNVKRPLLAWLSELRSLRLIGAGDYPKLEEMVLPGKLAVFDLSDIENQRKKQIIVSYLCRRLFKLRKREKIAPFLLVVEEAHNFAPEKMEKQHALSRGPIITIAREGRKFGACLCLISQRPVQLATTALSQCNTNIILRITNPFDIDHVGESCEGIDKAMLDSITTLRVGEALIVGEAVGSPIFVKIRKRKAEFSAKGKDLELIARRFEEEKAKVKKDVEAFL
ncbi:DNA double-strand break repair helicase HerA [uncultured archaeon]|nr:DNA double-strand break repair helicase HerA [uncultured archaeon]